MPICTGKDEQGPYVTWSHKTGKKYYVKDEGGIEGATAKARQQAAAAHASGYESDRPRCMRKGEVNVSVTPYRGKPKPEAKEGMGESVEGLRTLTESAYRASSVPSASTASARESGKVTFLAPAQGEGAAYVSPYSQGQSAPSGARGFLPKQEDPRGNASILECGVAMPQTRSVPRYSREAEFVLAPGQPLRRR